MVTSSWLLAAGVLLGLGWTAVQIPAKMAVRAIDEGLCLLLGSLFGSRLGHVLVHWSYYQPHWGEIPQVWLGGLSAAGALAGAVITLFLLAVLTRQPAGKLADRLLPLGVMVATAGWIAGWWTGSGYGPLAEGKWWGFPVRDESGVYAPRLPLQLMEAVVTLGIYWFLDKLRLPEKRGLAGKSGLPAALGFLVLSLQLLVLTFVRADSAPVWNGLRVDAWAAIGLSILAVILTAITFWPRRSV